MSYNETQPIIDAIYELFESQYSITLLKSLITDLRVDDRTITCYSNNIVELDRLERPIRDYLYKKTNKSYGIFIEPNQTIWD